VGRKTRAIPAAIARALRARDGGCRWPGCDHTRFCEGHHILHWANAGETKLDNLITLCSFHHELVHEGGFEITRTHDGVFVFTRPDGRRIAPNGSVIWDERLVALGTRPTNDCLVPSPVRLVVAAAAGGTASAATSAAGAAPAAAAAPPDSVVLPMDAAGKRFRGNAPQDTAANEPHIVALNRAAGLSIDETTARCRWTGEVMDYGLAVEALYSRDRPLAVVSPGDTEEVRPTKFD
jgi:hypothetical protein